jgi:16S rRNA (guanine527-N7)-methyltransferase
MIRSGKQKSSALDLSADRKRALELTPVANDIAARLDRYVGLLLEWQTKINLIANSTVGEIWTRHIADSLQLLSLAPSARAWVDLGSGAGFPGLVVACALAGQAGARVHLVESTKKKTVFLEEVARALDLPAIVHPVRIEDFAKTFEERPDIVTARALAPLEELLELAAPLLKTGAKGLFLKGQDVEAELTQAAKCWTINSTLAPSKTNSQARIVFIHSAVRHNKQ